MNGDPFFETVRIARAFPLIRFFKQIFRAFPLIRDNICCLSSPGVRCRDILRSLDWLPNCYCFLIILSSEFSLNEAEMQKA